jgi:mannose/cellobiose epimerase-like protein (N-acyl-D-glucosamine 2-epimerase family)
MNHCYGVAFVLLAYSCALKAGIEQARALDGRDLAAAGGALLGAAARALQG